MEARNKPNIYLLGIHKWNAKIGVFDIKNVK